jgi:hypothetical protein
MQILENEAVSKVVQSSRACLRVAALAKAGIDPESRSK